VTYRLLLGLVRRIQKDKEQSKGGTAIYILKVLDRNAPESYLSLILLSFTQTVPCSLFLCEHVTCAITLALTFSRLYNTHLPPHLPQLSLQYLRSNNF
jgi:hypothetical protein